MTIIEKKLHEFMRIFKKNNSARISKFENKKNKKWQAQKLLVQIKSKETSQFASFKE